jgi:hypothetical protein
MTGESDITATVIFHREGAFAVAALASFGDLVAVARAAGLVVETQAVLDRPDDATRHIVELHGRWIDTVKEVSFGDLGLSRNAGAGFARGRYLSFLDGDDLWGDQWFRAAFAAASAPAAPPIAIWHPEHLYVFSTADFDSKPHEGYRAFRSLMRSSDTPGFNPATLLFHNFWSANAFATRELHLRFPYRAVDREHGFGIEDWTWNLETLGAGIGHRVVPGTVHLIRKRGSRSLDQQNQAEGLLPRLPPSFVRGLRWP